MLSTLDWLVAVNQSVYCYSFVPQAVANYRRRSGDGLSYGMLFTLFNAIVWLLVCFLCLPMPFFYRVSLVLQLVGTLTWMGQRFYYAPWTETRFPLVLFLINAALVMAITPLAVREPLWIGNLAGWLGIFLLLINRVPQVIKVFRARSVEGMDFGFVLLHGCAAVMAMTLAFVWGLPMQAVCTSSIALLAFVVFVWQFYLYKWR